MLVGGHLHLPQIALFSELKTASHFCLFTKNNGVRTFCEGLQNNDDLTFHHLVKWKYFLMKQWALSIVSSLVPFRLVLGFDLLVFVFGKFPVVFCTWLCMFCATVIIPYGLFFHWAQGYCSSSHRVIRSLFYGMLFTLFQTVGLGFGPTYIALSYALPPASRFIVILEQVGAYLLPIVVLTLLFKIKRVLFSDGVKCLFHSLN